MKLRTPPPETIVTFHSVFFFFIAILFISAWSTALQELLGVDLPWWLTTPIFGWVGYRFSPWMDKKLKQADEIIAFKKLMEAVDGKS